MTRLAYEIIRYTTNEQLTKGTAFINFSIRHNRSPKKIRNWKKKAQPENVNIFRIFEVSLKSNSGDFSKPCK